MTLYKRAACVIVMAAFAMFGCVFAGGCGKQPAATWAHGEVTEDEVTNVANNMRSYYQITDDESWAQFVSSRAYDTSDELANAAGNSAIQEARDKGSSAGYSSSELGANIQSDGTNSANAEGSSSASTQASNSADAQATTTNDGTVEQLREYIIEQIIRQKIIDREIKERNITVSDAEINEFVEQQRASVEAQLMKGVFESYLQSQGYASLDAYKEDVRTQFLQLKLAQEVAGKDAEDGSKSVDSEAWVKWLDGMYADAGVKINPAPSDLTYAVKTTSSSASTSTSAAADSQQSSQGSTGSENTQQEK